MQNKQHETRAFGSRTRAAVTADKHCIRNPMINIPRQNTVFPVMQRANGCPGCRATPSAMTQPPHQTVNG